MMPGMLRLSYHRKNMSLSLWGKFVELQYSESNLERNVNPIGCDNASVSAVQPVVYNKAMLLAQDLYN